MDNLLIRASSIAKIMTEPKTKAEGVLSVGAKTYIRELAQQEIFGVEFTFSSKETEKGIRCEEQAIALLNRVRGLNLTKNSERRNDGFITGEADLVNQSARRGHDTKCSWSAKTFPAFEIDAIDKTYEWQARAYMKLWDCDYWEINYALLDTPDDLIGYEPLQLHIVSHIPEHMRLTSWVIERDMDKETAMMQKVIAAREYMKEVIQEFDLTHKEIQIG